MRPGTAGPTDDGVEFESDGCAKSDITRGGATGAPRVASPMARFAQSAREAAEREANVVSETDDSTGGDITPDESVGSVTGAEMSLRCDRTALHCGVAVTTTDQTTSSDEELKSTTVAHLLATA